MADAAPITFQTETPAKTKAAHAKVIADEAARKAAEPAPVVEADRPKPGDTFVPERGKTGVWRALGGEAGDAMAAVIIH